MKVTELLSDPARWTRGAWARDARGIPVNVMDPTAVCWCFVGAIIHEYPDASGQLDRAKDACESPSLFDFNDNSTHEEVVAFARSLGL